MTGPSSPQSYLRWGAGAAILVLIIVVVITDVFGRLLIDATFNVSDLMLGTLIGAELAIIGVDVSRLKPKNGSNGEPK